MDTILNTINGIDWALITIMVIGGAVLLGKIHVLEYRLEDEKSLRGWYLETIVKEINKQKTEPENEVQL